MKKYHIITNLKNDNYVHPEKWDSTTTDQNKKEYYISFKCIGDSYNECIEKLFERYHKIISKNSILNIDIEDATIFNVIDTEKCPRWEKMFLEKCNA